MKTVVLWLLCLGHTMAVAQSKKELSRMFQLSVAPGLGTNGLNPGSYANYFSINFTSGYSAANYFFEVASVSNLNVNETRGIQLAGLVNLTGANSFAGLQPKEIDKKKREGFEANLSGLQFSGVTNIVLNNVFGGQFTGGFNVAGGGLQGIQVAGIANMVSKYSFGIQLAGLWNISASSMDGLQLSALYNMTRNELFGLQIGLWNRCGKTEGINSIDTKDPTGIQVGFFNQASSMNGFQVGVINFGKQVQGTQIGIINIYRGGKNPQTRDGTSIGLINIGATGYAALYANELFAMNIEVATGTVKNGRITGENTTREVVNGLIYGRNPGIISSKDQWVLGYGLKKMFLNRSASPGFTHMRYLMTGLDLLHYNHSSSFTRELSIIARPLLMAGSRIHPRNKTFSFFIAAAYNFYKSGSGRQIEHVFARSTLEKKEGVQHWPGFSAGVLVR